ncbi:MAG: S26 family signal peptidase, partial [candidate division Zixibacteria bacterium]|nr:S26 family signal peptidase [candidate division Zixibacteria bacterium]
MIKPYQAGEVRKRSPWAALVFGLITPGLGLLYCGQMKHALLVLLAAIIPWLLIAVLSDPSVKIILLIVYAAIYVAQILWAILVALRLGSDYRLRRCNRAIVYALFFMLFAVYNEIDSSYFTELSTVSSESMAPALGRNDMVMINKLAYHRGSPAVGDAVIYFSDSSSTRRFWGRIIAGP